MPRANYFSAPCGSRVQNGKDPLGGREQGTRGIGGIYPIGTNYMEAYITSMKVNPTLNGSIINCFLPWKMMKASMEVAGRFHGIAIFLEVKIQLPLSFLGRGSKLRTRIMLEVAAVFDHLTDCTPPYYRSLYTSSSDCIRCLAVLLFSV